MQQEQQGSHPTFETAPQARPAAAQEAAEPGARTSVRDLSTRELGARGELMAANNLAGRGWEILGRNWRCPFGEVDIVAHPEGERKVIALVEVKTRLALGQRDDPIPELAVDAEKRERYRRCALSYLMEHPEVETVRFDVIALNVYDENNARMRHLIGAYVVDN